MSTFAACMLMTHFIRLAVTAWTNQKLNETIEAVGLSDKEARLCVAILKTDSAYLRQGRQVEGRAQGPRHPRS